MTTDINWIRDNARSLDRIRYFEDFTVGQRISHRWGRTLTESDNVTLTTLTLNYQPIFFNRNYARQKGHEDLVVNPMLLTLTTIGLSVQDLSEAGGAFLGMRNLEFHRPVLVGETITACSEVLEARPSASRPEMGVVTWRTAAVSDGDTVLTYERSNMLPRRGVGGNQ